MTDPPALTLLGIAKRFGHTVALDDAHLAVHRGTVHAVLGENGAGKTTLMRIAFGMLTPDSGQITVDGRDVHFHSPADAIRTGLGMVHQHFTNVPAMTVAENVALGGHGRFDRGKAAAIVRRVSADTGLTLDPTARLEDLPVGAQQRVEIVKALARNATTLVLDEPTAVLAPAEIDELLRWTRRYADRGNSVVLITHKLREALAAADEVTVLRRGRTVLTAAANDVDESTLARALVGDEQTTVSTTVPAAESSGDVAVSAERLTVLDERGLPGITDATFALRRGEVVGVAAVEGSGHRELLRVVARRAAVTSGTLALPPTIGFVPEDRHRDALVLDFSLPENVALRGAGTRRGRMSWTAFRDRAADLIASYDVRGGSLAAPARSLSGGNQQKLILARELADAPALLVVENPTRGLDIRATAAVHDRLRTAAAGGAAVLLYSSDLDEVLSLASRVLVVHAGRVTEAPPDRDRVGSLMLGVA